MKTTTSFVPVGEVITDAVAPLRDWDFGRLGKPFYVSAAFRALRKMCFDTNFNKRIWTAEINQDTLINELPKGYLEADGAWLFNGDQCNVNYSTVLFIKDNMHRLGGSGYVANNKWINLDPMQFSYGPTARFNGWSSDPPACLHFAGTFDGTIHFSDSCRQYQFVHMLYTSSVDQCDDDLRIPEWAAEAVTDYITMRGAEALEREDPQHLSRLIARKDAEMKAPNGSWRTAEYYYKRLDKKGRYDLAAKTFGFGHTP